MRRIALAFALVLAATLSFAAEYPTKNINIIVPYGPGGSTDLAVRTTVECIPDGILPAGVTFTVTNMPGGSGLVGAAFVANAPKDGYTVCGLTGDFVYCSVRGTTDMPLGTFKPLIWMQVDPYVLAVKSGQSYKNLKEFVDHIKANPGKIKFGDSGPGAVTHLVGVAMQKALGIDFPSIGYDNSLEAAIATVNGEAHATASHSTGIAGQMKAGEIIPIAVSSTKRSPIFPDVPSIAEIFPNEAKDINILSTMSLAVHADVPADIQKWLYNAFSAAVKTDAYKEKMKLFQAQDISDWTPEATQALYDQMGTYYKVLSQE